MSIRVGIDLGTTFSAVAMMDPETGKPKIIPNSEGSPITPSVIQFIDGEPHFGSEAESAFNAGAPWCVATFKRSMGTREPCCRINGRPYTAEDLSALLLQHLKEEAEQETHQHISEAVITVPAYFFSDEREATLHAAERAGLKVKKIIDEPNAAAMAYGLNNWRENANILVYDLGGGTFDVTLIHMMADGELQTIVTRGDHKLGGRDWDECLLEIMMEKFSSELDEELDDQEDKAIVRGLAESVKKNLSKLAKTTVSAFFPQHGKASIEVSREEFETATRHLLERTCSLCRSVLDEAGVRLDQVTDVLLVGGSTRMPQVSAVLTEIFGKKPITHVNPDEAVALGAAIQVEKQNSSYVRLKVEELDGKKTTSRDPGFLTDPAAVKPSHKLSSADRLMLRETTAHAMGVVAILDEENRYYNEVIIPANHPRPVRAAKRFRFYTHPGTDNTLTVYVLQGDKDAPSDCLLTHKYTVSGIQHVEHGEDYGTVIRIQYSYDDNGIIRIQARQEQSNTDLPIRQERVNADELAAFSGPVQRDSSGSQSPFLQASPAGAGAGVVHKYRAVTFSNTEWETYDNVAQHEDGSSFNEPKVHIIAEKQRIEFHGYNISRMDEGVRYTIGADDDFEIECDVDTSTISPHPGGYLQISLGIISAQLTENGGNILLRGQTVAKVDPRFHLLMSLNKGGLYTIKINGAQVGSDREAAKGSIDVVFGFVHDSHYCQLLSHAYISDISMKHRLSGSDDDESTDTETWE